MTTDPRALVERLRKGYDDWRFTILADAADAIEALLAERDSFETLWRSTMDVLKAERAERDALRAEMAKEGWRQCAVGQRTTQFCGQLEAAVLAEREACAKVCEELRHELDLCGDGSPYSYHYADQAIGAEKCANEIRSRGAA